MKVRWGIYTPDTISSLRGSPKLKHRFLRHAERWEKHYGRKYKICTGEMGFYQNVRFIETNQSEGRNDAHE